jgi:hypothetical protein
MPLVIVAVVVAFVASARLVPAAPADGSAPEPAAGAQAGLPAAAPAHGQG